MTVHGPFEWSCAARTHVGMVRRLNEDAYVLRPDVGLWAVADGMGGHAAGDIASRMVVDALSTIGPPSSLDAFVYEVQHCLRGLTRRLREEAVVRRKEVVGATVVVLLAFDRQCACLWAGDSRIYRFRTNELQQLTRDHSQVEDLIDAGLLQREEAENHPSANIVTRAIGEIDVRDADASRQVVSDGDLFLLCSDGLNKEVSDAEIASVLNESELHQASQALEDLALSRGAHDNVTVVLVRADD